MKIFYGILTALGLVLPYSQLIPWLRINGFDIPLLINEAASSQIAAFGWLDVIVSAVVLLGFIVVEGGRRKMRYLWLPIVGTLTVGVSFGLPLFLLMKEFQRDDGRID